MYKNITDVQGSTLKSLGRFNFLFHLPDGSAFSFPAFVISNLSSSCILGADFLRNARINLNLHNNTASLPDGSIAAITLTTPEQAAAIPDIAAAAANNALLPILRSGETTTLPPFSSKHVSTIAHFPPGMAPPKNGLVECHGDENAILNGAIAISADHKAKVTMLNPTAQPITIPRGEIVAHISSLPDEHSLIQLLPATEEQPIAAVRLSSSNTNTACHFCNNEDENCNNCTSIATIQESPPIEQNLLQATSCVTNASWGPKAVSAKTGIHNKFKEEIDQTIQKLSFKEKQLHLRKNLKISCTDQNTAKKYWALVDKFHDIFSDSEDDLGHTTSIEHDIKLKSNDPIHIKQFRIPFSQRQFIETKVNHLVKQKVLENSTSPYNTPIFAIPKKPVPGQPQGYRLIQDLRAINEHSLTDKYNLADIKECMDKVGTRNAKVFSSLDLTSGFFQISIKPEARPFTAFTIPGKGKYQWARVCLGLHGAPSTFAKLMSLVMAGLPQAMTYLDDVLVASSSHENHLTELKQCFVRLRQHGLKLNPFKTELAAPSVQYLGHTLTADGITVSDLKCKAIENFPVPTSKASIRQFVGLANFYRPLIKDFNKHSGHLTALIKDKANYRNGPMPQQAQDAFFALKNQLIKRPVIAFPDPNKPFHLATDAASGDDTRHGGLGAVLTQVVDGHHRTIAYASRSLRDSENNYSAYLLELLAIVWAIDHFSVYLHNTHFTVYTDHKPIPKMAKAHKKTFNRLHQLMNEYNCEIVYRAGKDNAVADALSRNTVASIHQDFKQSPDNIRQLQAQDELCQIITKLLNSKDTKAPKQIAALASQCAIQDGILVIFLSTHHDGLRSRIITPKILRKPIIQSAHCSRFAGHLATNKTLMRIQSKFWWPLMTKDIATFIDECFSCQLTKDPHKFKSATAPLQPLQVPDRPNVRVHADLFGPLTKSKAGNKFILVITDAFSKFTRVAAIPNKTATTVTKAIFNNWICLFGPMTYLLTDNGKEFANAVNKDLCQLLDINRQFTSSIHPQTNASAETFNKWIIHYMKTNHLDKDEDWEDLLAPMMMAYNSAVHDSTKKSPFFLTFGVEPSSPLFPAQGPTAPLTTPWSIKQQQALKIAHSSVLKNIAKTRELMIKAQKQVTTKSFHKNQRILIWYPKSSFTGKGLNAKFQKQWAPGIIASKISDLTYNVLKDGSTQTFVCHVNRLKPMLGHFPTQSKPSPKIKPKPHAPPANKYKTKTKFASQKHFQHRPSPKTSQESQAYQLPDLWPPPLPPRDYDDFTRSSQDSFPAASQMPSFAVYRNNPDHFSLSTSDDFVSLPSFNANSEEEEGEEEEVRDAARSPSPQNPQPQQIPQESGPTHREQQEDDLSDNINQPVMDPSVIPLPSDEDGSPSQQQQQPSTPPQRENVNKDKTDVINPQQAAAAGPKKKSPPATSTPIKQDDAHRQFGDNTMLSSIQEEEDEAQEKTKTTEKSESESAESAQDQGQEKISKQPQRKGKEEDAHGQGQAQGKDTLAGASKEKGECTQGNASTLHKRSAADQIRRIIAERSEPQQPAPPLPQVDRYPKRQRPPQDYYKEESSSDSLPLENDPKPQQHPEIQQQAIKKKKSPPCSPAPPSAVVTIETEASSHSNDGETTTKTRREGQETSSSPPPPLPPKLGRSNPSEQ